MSVKYDFSGKRAVVTGGLRGIGRDITIKLVESGCHVLALHSSSKYEPLDSKLPVTPIQCDVTSKQEDIEKLLGPHLPVDYLVNNAGIGELASCLSTSADMMQSIYDVNVKGALALAQICGKNMIDNKRKGAIVNISSQAGLKPLLDHTAYCASKAALDAITRNLALELGQFGIRANSVNPTVVLTDMGVKAWMTDEAKSKREHMLSQMPLNRFAEISEVTDAVLWLLSDGSSMTTGHCLPVDGGVTTC